MIFQFVNGYGPSSVALHGAPGETVTYTGKDSGSVTLDDNGDGTASMRVGTYSFTGSKSGYTKSGVVVTPRTAEVNVWPGTALFWYGRQNATFNYSGAMTAGYPKYVDDYIRLYRSMPQYSGTFFYAPAMDLTNYTSFHAIGYRTGNTALGGPLVSTHSSFNFNTSNRVLTKKTYPQNTRGEVTLDISAITGTNYVGIGDYTYYEYNNITDYTYAMWLE